jgi:hypothetical protein
VILSHGVKHDYALRFAAVRRVSTIIFENKICRVSIIIFDIKIVTIQCMAIPNFAVCKLHFYPELVFTEFSDFIFDL